ncbi:MAG: SRPBCC family protein [Candidatus Taylorbacteria bacterium]|nr:SRPBCC family protein [Candidatus Taylorbacteria bacterium]
MKDISLHAKWLIKAPLAEVFRLMTDFEKFPEYFPKVAESIKITKRDGNHLQIEAVAKSFGRNFPVKMNTEILPGKGYISDNESPEFGTSGHEEFLLSLHPEGTEINYTYEVAIHKRWLRIFAKPLIGWFSMKFWEKAVIDELRKRLEKKLEK